MTKLFFGPRALDSLEIEKCRENATKLQHIINKQPHDTIEGELALLRRMVECNSATKKWPSSYIPQFRSLNIEELFDRLAEEWINGGTYSGAHLLVRPIPGTPFITVSVVPKEHPFSPLCWIERLGFLKSLEVTVIPTIDSTAETAELPDHIPLDDIIDLEDDAPPRE
jgi:hypothetical protein